MSSDDRTRIGSESFTESAPNYDSFGREAKLSIGTAAALVGGTVGLLWLFRDTEVAATSEWLFLEAPGAPLVGPVAFACLVAGGRYVGIRAAVAENYPVALGASAVVATTYAAIGATVLSLYPAAVQADALVVALVLTVVVTAGIAKFVFTTARDLGHLNYYSGLLLGGGAVLMGVDLYGAGSTFTLGFVVVLAGWVVDLAYEIYMISDTGRSPIANGIGVYVAVMGVFIHFLLLAGELSND